MGNTKSTILPQALWGNFIVQIWAIIIVIHPLAFFLFLEVMLPHRDLDLTFELHLYNG